MCLTPLRYITHKYNTYRHMTLYFWETTMTLVHTETIPSHNPGGFLTMIRDHIVSARWMQVNSDFERKKKQNNPFSMPS